MLRQKKPDTDYNNVFDFYCFVEYIGEFPDVIAAEIRNAILEDRDMEDSGLKELMEARNSFQTRALEELWSYKDGTVTTSSIIRRRLIELCNQKFDLLGTSLEGRVRHYRMPDGMEIQLSDNSGMPESISLSSVPFDFAHWHFPNTYIKCDETGNYAAFLYGTSWEYIIRHEAILELMDNDLTEEMICKGYPKMLPDMGRLTLNYAIACDIDKRPDFWLNEGNQA